MKTHDNPIWAEISSINDEKFLSRFKGQKTTIIYEYFRNYSKYFPCFDRWIKEKNYEIRKWRAGKIFVISKFFVRQKFLFAIVAHRIIRFSCMVLAASKYNLKFWRPKFSFIVLFVKVVHLGELLRRILLLCFFCFQTMYT